MVDGKKFEEMFNLNVEAHTETLDTGGAFKPTYLSWSSAVLLAKKNFDGFQFRNRFNSDGTPVFYNELVDGFFVVVEVTTDNYESITTATLPVLDNKFKPQGKSIRTYIKKGWKGKPDETKEVQPVNSFDVNYTQMRCLTKAIAIETGIGLKLYFKEGVQSAMHRDELKKEHDKEQKEIDEQAELEREDKLILVEGITSHKLYEEEKVRTYFASKNVQFSKSGLMQHSNETLEGVIAKLDKTLKKRESE